MKKLKKVFAVLLSVAMILGMSTTAFASEQGDHKPVPTDKATITVNNVEPGAKVKAFKVAKGNWNDQGFTGYEAIEVGGVKIANVSKPTSAELTAIANAVDKAGGIELNESSTGVYTKELEVGAYLILVTANAEGSTTAYNPMIASVYYSTEKSGDLNDQFGGTVSAKDNFVIDGQILWAKHDEVDIEKEIVNPGSENVKGDDTAIGDEIEFKITSAFPAYSKAYTRAEFNIIDTLSKGLTVKPNTVTVKIGNKDIAAEGNYTVKPVTIDDQTSATTMRIEFTSDCVLANTGEPIEVHYKADLNDQAGINFDKNTNTVKAEYTNNPTTNAKGETEEKKTYHYTFGIDADINGTGSEVTKEVYKVHGEDGKAEIIEVETGRVEVTNPLNGAEFELRTKDGEVVDTTTSGDGGVAGDLQFIGLDAGEYILVETKAPEGYSLDDTEHTVVISASYNTDGTLKDYTITIDGKSTSTYAATYDKGEVTSINYDKLGSVAIKNLNIGELPSTGGIGTIIFTVGGCLIMVVAAALYFANRRRSANSESK